MPVLRTFILRDGTIAAGLVAFLKEHAGPMVAAGTPLQVTVAKHRRTRSNLEQNALMWALLQAFSDQLLWPVNGSMQRLEKEEWKDLLTAGFRQEQPRLAAGLRGGVVMMGLSTRKMGKREMADFITFIQSEAADRGVLFDEVAV